MKEGAKVVSLDSNYMEGYESVDNFTGKPVSLFFFFFNDPAPTEFSPLPLPAPLPIWPVQLRLYTRPGTGRLILPTGMGCATCDDARQIAEDLRDSAPDLIQLDVIDITEQETRSEEHTSELQSQSNLVCRLLLEKKKKK